MEMRDHTIPVDEDHGIGGWLMGAGNAIGRKIKRGLMIGTAQDADRYAAPAPGDRAVRMSGKNVLDIAVLVQQRMKRLCFDDAHAVKQGHVNGKWRMVREKEHRAVPRLDKAIAKP